jgi:nitroreductase
MIPEGPGMRVGEAVRARRMVRAFTPEPLAPAVVDGLIDLARRAPSAGNSQGMAYVVLDGPEQTARYWDITLPRDRRASFRWPGLVTAPALIVVLVRPEAWVERYAEADKATTGLGAGAGDWPVPYWWVDAGMAVEHLLLGAVDAGLAACLFGLFEHEAAVLAALGVPPGWRGVGTVALGHPGPDEPGRSSARPRPPLAEVVHRGRW